MDKKLLPLLYTSIITLLFFTVKIFINKNYEFLFYLFVVILLMGLILKAHKKVKFPMYVLWNLYLWATLHLAGGNLYIQETKLYDYIFYPFIGEPFNILKYDQVIHAYGFFVATLAIYYSIKPLLKRNHNGWIALGVVVVMAGLGLGALNEIIEFTTTIITPDNGVGGYINNALDLVTDLIGALLAFIFIKYREC